MEGRTKAPRRESWKCQSVGECKYLHKSLFFLFVGWVLGLHDHRLHIHITMKDYGIITMETTMLRLSIDADEYREVTSFSPILHCMEYCRYICMYIHVSWKRTVGCIEKTYRFRLKISIMNKSQRRSFKVIFLKIVQCF